MVINVINQQEKLKLLKPMVRVLLILSLLLSAPIKAELKIAYVDVPPFAFQNIYGRPQGMLIDAFREITAAIDQQPEFIHLPHRRLIPFIEQGEVDVWAGLRNSLISSDIALTSNTPLFVMDLRVYWTTGSDSIDSFNDLKGKKLILISSYSYGGNLAKFVKESVDIDFVINHEQGFENLFANSDYYLLGYNRISEEVVRKFEITGFEQAPLAKYDLYLKLSKSHPKAEQFMQNIDDYLVSQATKPIELAID